MRKIIIEPVQINFKTLKFPHLEKMLSGMLIPLLRLNFTDVFNDVKKFCNTKDHKPSFQYDQILSNCYHVKLVIEELSRRTCGDYKKNMSKTSLQWKVAFYYFKYTETKNGKQVIVEINK